MANDQQVALLKQGVAAWNAWRHENPTIRPDLSGAILSAGLDEANLRAANLSRANLGGASLGGANLSGASLTEAYLGGAKLWVANLSGANLSSAILDRAELSRANLSGANLTEAKLIEANLYRANLSAANLSWANLSAANLSWANLRGAHLLEAFLARAYLADANLREADLSGACLEGAQLMETDLRGANLTGCLVYGVSAWGLKLDEETKQQNLVITKKTGRYVFHGVSEGLKLDEETKQQNLVITKKDEPEITVDNIEVAQFIYLMLSNEKVRDVIDTITSKAVLILGRFTEERKAVLDALREELRKRDYLPILFDFAVPATRDITETVSLLARMARFIIADLTDPSSIPKELEAIVPQLAVPVQPLLEGSSRPYAMFKDYWKYEWVLPVYRYEGLEPLLATLAEKVIAPAEGKVKALQERRRMIEAELTKPQ